MRYCLTILAVLFVLCAAFILKSGLIALSFTGILAGIIVLVVGGSIIFEMSVKEKRNARND